MRYRRYYTQKNKDGSRTVVSTGPAATLWMGFVKFIVVVGLLGWPAIVVGDNLRGALAWVIGVPCELIWLVIALGVWGMYDAKAKGRVRGDSETERLWAATHAEMEQRHAAILADMKNRPLYKTPLRSGLSIADELLKLTQLRDQGALSPEEFEAQKAKLLR
ncbi:MAG: SHOCT domain-containing protein [Acidimicrobiales bacterium]